MIGYNPETGAVLHGSETLPAGFEPWLVKFPNTHDGADAGAVEYVYSQMARASGVDMTETRLFPARNAAGYFATRRFDRDDARRLHTHTASGLLHADHRTPSLDYRDLTALSARLARDIREAERMVRLAAFNVLAHNRDDHAKNFTFLMDEAGEWRPSPAYDLTFSDGPGGEQTTMVMGEGKSPGVDHLTRLGEDSGVQRSILTQMIQQTREAVSTWRELAGAHGVRRTTIRHIEDRLAAP